MGQPVSFAPIANLLRRAECQHHRAMLVDILPCLGGRNSEVYPKIVKARRFSVVDRDRYRLSLRRKPGVDSSIASHQRRHTKRTPNAGRPPASPLAFDPMNGGSE